MNQAWLHRASRALRSALAGHWLFAVLMGVLFPSALLAERFETKRGEYLLVATISKDSVQIAEPLELQLELIGPAQATVEFPELKGSWGDLEIQQVSELKTLPISQGRQWIRTITIDSLVAGDFTIPSVAVQIHKPGEKAFVIASPEIPIHITSMLEDRAEPTALRDIKPLIDLEPAGTSLSKKQPWILGGIFLIAALSMGAYWLIRRRRSPEILADQWAQQQLQTLETRLAQQDITSRDFAAQLTWILSRFLAYQCPDTADQVLSDSTRSVQTEGRELPNWQEPLRQVLSLADEVKFGARALTEQEMRELLETVRVVIAEFASNQLDLGPIVRGSNS